MSGSFVWYGFLLSVAWHLSSWYFIRYATKRIGPIENESTVTVLLLLSVGLSGTSLSRFGLLIWAA